MVVKVAMADHFQFKVMPSIKNFCLLKQGDVHYIGGTDILPAPLGASEEQNAIEALGTASDAEAKHTLIEHRGWCRGFDINWNNRAYQSN